MAKITLIKNDNSVYVDGVMKHVDLSSLPADFHALQYDEIRGTGVLETINPLANTPIDANEFLAQYRKFVDQWHGI